MALGNGAEGFVSVRTLEDWFEFDERRMTLCGERTGRTFSLGQRLRVRVTDARPATGEIDLEISG